MNFKKFYESIDREYWYHGDSREVTSFRDHRMDRDPAAQQSELMNGPGIYFTEDQQEALGYAEPDGYVYKVSFDDAKFIDENTSLTEELTRKLINWMPEEKREQLKKEYMEELKYDYDDDDELEEAAEKELEADIEADALEFAFHGKNNFLAPSINLYKEYYGHEYANEFTNSLEAFGIDGIRVKFDGRNHVVVYNPKVIDIWDVKHYSEAHDEIYGDE